MPHPEQEYLEYVVRGIVSAPGSVRTDRAVDDLGVLLTLHVAADDMAVIIGKEGRTAKALRTLLRAYGATLDARVNLKIIEPEGSRLGFSGKEADELPRTERAIRDALKDLPTDELG